MNIAVAALVLLGAHHRISPEELAVAAQAIHDACNAPPAYRFESAMALNDCAQVVAILWSLETNGSFALRPRARYGCGPLQVNPVRSRRLTTPTCQRLVNDLPLAFLWGARMFRVKLAKAGGNLRRAFLFYNGHPRYKKAYARRAMALWLVLAPLRDAVAPLANGG